MNKDERIGESIWDTYKMMGDALAEGLQDSPESKEKNTARGVIAKIGRKLGPKVRRKVKAVKRGANEVARDVIAGQDAARAMGADEP